MTVRVRVIPCLDVRDGRVVKGVNFVQLRDAGALTLDDPLTKWLPNFDTGGRAITLRHLLTHTSGNKPGIATSGITSYEDGVARACRNPLGDAPGAVEEAAGAEVVEAAEAGAATTSRRSCSTAGASACRMAPPCRSSPAAACSAAAARGRSVR